jgi:membrane glycosyltransferase
MLARRLVFAAIGCGAACGLGGSLLGVLASGGWTWVKTGILLCFAGVAPWLGICAGNAVLGLGVLLTRRDPARAVLPVAGDIGHAEVATRTALAVTVRHEDMTVVLPPLRRLLDGLDAAGAGGWFALFVLSDSDRDDGEAAAVADFAAADRDPGRIHYRRRARNTGFKAGNVMDFLDHHADRFPLAVMLDADSEMTAAAVLRLVRIMRAAPSLGIVQHLTVGRPADTGFARLFQFGMRAGMRVWATGQAAWQGDEGPYWGHNAILRAAPFRDHARLPTLPGGGVILSHDQVEAALLRAAGWGVAVWTGEDGSLETNPPALPEFVARDARWLAGNLQYVRLLFRPGFRPMGRWQLLQAILLFLGAPLYAAMFALAVVNAATGGADALPRRQLLILALAWSVTLYGPKLLGYAGVLMSRAERARYGGAGRFALGAGCEIVFTLLLDAPMTLTKTLALVRVLLGRRPAWLPQNRAARAVTWREALRMLWPHTLAGVVAFGVLANVSWAAVAFAGPFAGGLLLGVPLAVASAAPGPSEWLRRRRVAATPEELAATRSAGG